MKKQMKWGLATLMLLLGIAAVFLFIDKDTTTEPEMTLGQQTKDLLKQGVKSPQQANTSGAEKRQPPPGASPNGHKHGDEWHDEPHETAPEVSGGKLSHTNPLESSTTSDHSLEKMRELKKRIDNINVRVQEKYPDLQDLVLLTPEEIHVRYPTDNDKLVLAQKAEDFLDEFLQEIKNAFADAPIEIRKSVLDEIRPQLISSLGIETADAILVVVQDLKEYK